MSQRGRVFLDYASRQLGRWWKCRVFVAFKLGACGITDIPPNTGRTIILILCSKACCKFHNKGSGRITISILLELFTVAQMISPRPSGRQCLIQQGSHGRLTTIHKVESRTLLRASCRPRPEKPPICRQCYRTLVMVARGISFAHSALHQFVPLSKKSPPARLSLQTYASRADVVAIKIEVAGPGLGNHLCFNLVDI